MGKVIPFPVKQTEQEIFRIEILTEWTPIPLICLERVDEEEEKQ